MIWTVLATIAAVIAAVIPLMVWSQNKREQSTGSRLLAQMMITPIGATQVEIAKFRCAVVPPNGDQFYLVNVLNSQEARKDLASRASRIPVDLPQQFLDKASVFSELTNSKIAFALSQVNRLKSMSLMVGDLSDSDRVPGSGVTEPTEGALRAKEDGHRGSWLTLSLRT